MATKHPAEHRARRPRVVAVMILLALASACASVPAPEPEPPVSLQDPTDPRFSESAPNRYRATFETTEGSFTIEVQRSWAPRGADRFYNLVRHGFYDGVRFFRVLDGFVAQFGIHGDPEVSGAWREATLPDDPVVESNERGRVTFATAGPNTRTTQLFINLGDNRALDRQGFAPFGQVVEGMDVVERLYSGYGEGAPRGRGPDQGRIFAEGNEYLESRFPELDHVLRAAIEPVE